MDRTISFQEVRFQVNIEEISKNVVKVNKLPSLIKCCSLPSNSSDSVVNRQDVNALSILHVRTRLNRNDVRQADTQVIAHHTIHADLLVGASIIRQHNADRLLATLSLEQNGVASEQLKLVHLGLAQTHDRVVVVCGIVDNQTVRAILALQDCS